MNKKLALIVGHNEKKQGAVRSDSGETEWQFNSRVADLAVEYARKNYPNLDVRVFFRVPGLGYRKEIERVYDETDRWGANLTNELHFNSHADKSARGTEVLTSGTASSFKFAEITQRRLLAAFGTRDRGVKTRKVGRGAESLISGKAPAILSEPFFGSNPHNQDLFDETNEERRLAKVYIEAAAETLSLIPRTNIEESRTLKKTKDQAWWSVIGRRFAALGLGSLTIDQSDLEQALEFGGVLEKYLPYITGFGFLVAIVALYVIPHFAGQIEKFREEDYNKELR